MWFHDVMIDMAYLLQPEKRPQYRQHRNHLEFITSLQSIMASLHPYVFQ